MSDSEQRIALIGGGKMGRALIQGMLAAGFARPESVTVGEPAAASRQWWTENVPEVQVCPDNKSCAEAADIIIVAVKPAVVPLVLADLRKSARKAMIVSVAAGVSLEALGRAAGSSRVVRVMPNTPALVGQGASAYCCGDEITEKDGKLVEAMFSSVGLVVRVQEELIDAVTGLSGSGPAFICMVIEALADGGVKAGLPRDLAIQLATQTVLGTAQMVKETQTHPAQLKDAVASPGGTTIAGIATLEAQGLRNALISAVGAAKDRSVELSKK